MGTIAQKLTYLNGTKQALKESINNIGGDITSETTFREYAQELDNIYNNLPKTTGEDTSLSLTTLKGKMNIIPKGDTKQEGTPTPSTPINIEVVTGTQDVKVENVNLCENATTNANAGAYANILLLDMDLKPNTTYTISFKGASGNKIYLNENITTSQYFTCTGSRESRTFTIKSTIDTSQYIAGSGWIIFKNQSANTETPSFNNVQIEYGTTATTYTPHQEQTQIVSLGNIELCKIGNYQDYLYKSGDKWYKKENIGKYTFTGNETIDQFSSRTNTIRFSIANVLPPTLVAQEYNYNAYCNYLKAQDIYNNDVQGFFTHFNGSSATRIYIGLDKTIASTSEQAKTWLGNVKPILYYQLRTPNDIEITNSNLIEQLDNLEKLKSYNGTTNISSSGSLPMILNISALKGE